MPRLPASLSGSVMAKQASPAWCVWLLERHAHVHVSHALRETSSVAACSMCRRGSAVALMSAATLCIAMTCTKASRRGVRYREQFELRNGCSGGQLGEHALERRRQQGAGHRAARSGAVMTFSLRVYARAFQTRQHSCQSAQQSLAEQRSASDSESCGSHHAGIAANMHSHLAFIALESTSAVA